MTRDKNLIQSNKTSKTQLKKKSKNLIEKIILQKELYSYPTHTSS